MAEYHVSAGAFGIYAGKANKDGTEWLDKSDVTEECFHAVRDYLAMECEQKNQDCAGFLWKRKDGKFVELLVRIKDGDDNA